MISLELFVFKSLSAFESYKYFQHSEIHKLRLKLLTKHATSHIYRFPRQTKNDFMNCIKGRSPFLIAVLEDFNLRSQSWYTNNTSTSEGLKQCCKEQFLEWPVNLSSEHSKDDNEPGVRPLMRVDGKNSGQCFNLEDFKI